MNMKHIFAILVLANLQSLAMAQNRSVVMIPTPFQEDGNSVQLELVIYKPAEQGSFPTLVFNHGSVSNGNDPKEVRYTVTYPELAQFFNSKGWAVVLPQRRGRGQSGGQYAEGWDSEKQRYACDPALAQTSMARAMADLDATQTYLEKQSFVDTKRMLLGGHSKGGILAMAYAAQNPNRYLGVTNFVGGWVGERCEHAVKINAGVFTQSAKFPKSTLWLYGEKDPFYSIAHSKGSFDAFKAAGGRGEFHVFNLGFMRNDHQIVRTRSVWESTVADYLKQIDN